MEEAIKFCEEHECEDCPVIERRTEYQKKILHYPCCWNLIDESKWIPVNDKLPDDHEFVLMTIRRMGKEYNHLPFITVGYIGWNQTSWWCAHDGDCREHEIEVLAWMTLPEAYKGETN